MLAMALHERISLQWIKYSFPRFGHRRTYLLRSPIFWRWHHSLQCEQWCLKLSLYLKHYSGDTLRRALSDGHRQFDSSFIWPAERCGRWVPAAVLPEPPSLQLGGRQGCQGARFGRGSWPAAGEAARRRPLSHHHQRPDQGILLRCSPGFSLLD
jgi:hypothetical protein